MVQQPVDPVGSDRLVSSRPIAAPAPGTDRKGKAPEAAGISFKEILQQRRAAATPPPAPPEQAPAVQPLRFSSHAQERMKLRNISLSPEELAKLRAMVDKAASKGATESLILMDKLALVVSIKNRTVITAVDNAHLKENIFTNIDSAVIM